jgi:hypothetical protein
VEGDWRDDADPEDLFDSPEVAALAGWGHLPAANPRVVEVRVEDDRTVEVVVQLDAPPGYDRETCRCVRTSTGKWWLSDSSG